MAIAETPTAETTPPADATPKKERSKRSLAGIYVNTPKVLRDVLENEAKEKNVSVASLVRDRLAGVYNLTLPEAKPRTKYATAEEKAAARKKANASRTDLMRRLMGIHRIKTAALAKGENLSDEEAGTRWDAQEQERLAKLAAKAAEAQTQAPAEQPAA
jgi:hypothetical protein